MEKQKNESNNTYELNQTNGLNYTKDDKDDTKQENEVHPRKDGDTMNEASNLSEPNNSEKLKNTVDETFPKKKRNLKGIIFLLVVVLLFGGLLGYRIFERNKPPVEEEKVPVNIKVTSAQVTSISATSPLSGRVQPKEEVSVIPMANGKITNVNVKLGDWVAAGAVLFNIDQGSLGISYNQALDAYENAQTNLERMEILYKEGAVSLQQYEQAQSALISAETSLNTITENMKNYTVTAPISGYITSVNVSKGSMASGAGGPALVIADLSELLIKANISENLISKIKIGDNVKIYIKTLSDVPYNGRIKEISPAPANGLLTYPITISIDNSTKEVKAGMFAEVQIVSEHKANVLCVPSKSILIKNGESQVAVLVKDLPVFKPVTTGLDNGEFIEIISGIDAGDLVITEGQHFVTEGEPVTIIE